QVGDVIAWIEVEGETNEDTTTPDTEEVADAVSQPEPEVSPDIEEHNVIEEELLNKVSAAEERGVSTQQIPGTELLEQELREKTVLHSGSRFYSPLVKNIAQEEGLSQAELDSIIGTGAEGRVTKQDILDYLGKRSAQDPRVESEEIAVKTASSDQHVITPPSKEKENTPKITAPGDEIVEMDRMRRLI